VKEIKYQAVSKAKTGQLDQAEELVFARGINKGFASRLLNILYPVFIRSDASHKRL
jgi:hypothetical protein